MSNSLGHVAEKQTQDPLHTRELALSFTRMTRASASAATAFSRSRPHYILSLPSGHLCLHTGWGVRVP
jgi:hypothetical protein